MTIKSVQEFAIVYHGTSSKHAKEIRKHGFKSKKKESGATLRLYQKTGIEDSQSWKYHYVTTSLKEAAEYAKIHKNPEIVRVVCKKKWLDKDPEAGSDTAFRVEGDISHSLVLPRNSDELTTRKVDKISKKLFGEASIKNEDFKKALKDSLQSTEKDNRMIEQVDSAVKQVEDRNQKALKKIEQLTGGEFKEGEVFSIDPEDLE